MVTSVFDLFTIGIGPSSSHTVGPMRAARAFAAGLDEATLLVRTKRMRAELFGSLGATGHGHGADTAVVLGLFGETPESVDPGPARRRAADAMATGVIRVMGRHNIVFEPADLVLHRRQSLPFHPNGMRFTAYGSDETVLRESTYYSIGGGFVIGEGPDGVVGVCRDETPVPFPFTTAAELCRHCADNGLSVAEVMLRNELASRPHDEVLARLLRIWQAMQDCVRAGVMTDGVLPGGLKVRRRAPALYRALCAEEQNTDALGVMDWVNLYALAVNEENAAGGRVVTAPTNGAAGIIPAVLHYYRRFVPGASDDGVCRFLLTAGAIGLLYKENASISGAEVGCQGEVGSACSMAAGALCEVMGGTPRQVENAAEIAMEHNLGLTCDPVGGLVQIPCIERNAVAAVKAINAARIAMRGSGSHVVSLDKVIKTMRETGADMKIKYKETARGGLAVNVVEC